MVFSDNKGNITLFIIILLVVFGIGAYVFTGTQIKDFVNKNLLSQITQNVDDGTVLTTSPTTTPPPTPSPYANFINTLKSIVDEYKASPNKTQTVKRAQTTKALLDAFANEL